VCVCVWNVEFLARVLFVVVFSYCLCVVCVCVCVVTVTLCAGIDFEV